MFRMYSSSYLFVRPKKINCMFPLTRPTLFYAADPKLFSAPKIHFTPVDKYFFALSHLNVTNNHKKLSSLVKV